MLINTHSEYAVVRTPKNVQKNLRDSVAELKFAGGTKYRLRALPLCPALLWCLLR